MSLLLIRRGGRPLAITGLRASLLRTVARFAGSSGGTGSAQTPATPTSSVPGQVQNLRLGPAAATSSSLTVQWDAISGATCKVEMSADGGASYTVLARGVVTTSHTASGLPASAARRIRVSATFDGTNYGPASAVLTATTGESSVSPELASSGASSGGSTPSAPTPVPSQNGVAGPITDIAIDQPHPVHPAATYPFPRFAFCAAVGGIGPYSWDLKAAPGTTLKPGYKIDGRTGALFLDYYDIGDEADTVVVVCRDGTGSTFEKTFSPAKAPRATPILMVAGPKTFAANIADPYYQLTWPLLTPGFSGYDTRTVTDPAGVFFIDYGDLRLRRNPTPGDYPVRFEASGSAGKLTLDITFRVTAPTISAIQFVPVSMATSRPVGTKVGRALVTSPSNTANWELVADAGGKYAIDAGTGEITVAGNLTAGTDTITIKAIDKLVSRIDSFAIAVQQGNVLPSTNMTMAIPTGLTNAPRSQRIGTPTVTGITGTKTWSLQQNNVSLEMENNQYGGPRRYKIDPATGEIVAQAPLSAQTDELTVTCTDGLNTCTRVFSIPVAEHVGPTIHVGRGMTAKYGQINGTPSPTGTYGYDYLGDVYNLFQDVIGRGVAGAKVYIYSDPDPDYYANATAPRNGTHNRGGWQGPVTIEGRRGEAAGSPSMPRLGGHVGRCGDGCGETDKACLLIGNGDCTIRNIEVSWVTAPGDPDNYALLNGKDGIRKDDATYGNLLIDGCFVHDCDNNIHSGCGTGTQTVRNTVTYNAGTSYVSSGATHNFYMGRAWKVRLENVLSYRVTSGHDYKSRALRNELINCRFLDTERGGSSSQIDIPDGGELLIDGCVLHKGPNANAPACLNIHAERYPFWEAAGYYGGNELVTAVVRNSTFINTMPPGQHFADDGAIAVWHHGYINRLKQRSTVTLENNSYFGFPEKTRLTHWFEDGGPYPDDGASYAPVETGATFLSAMPALDLTPPLTRTPPVPRPGPLVHQQDGNTPGNNYKNYIGVQIDAGSDDLRIPRDVGMGTVVADCTATGSLVFQNSARPQPDIRINPFVAGTVWEIIRDPTWYGRVPWAPAGRYAIDASTGRLTVAGALVAGTDLVQIRATAPDGTKCDTRFWITVTSGES